MSSTIDNTVCPKCGGNALTETDTDTCETHIHCTEPDCSYDSDADVGNCDDCDVCDGDCGK